MTLAADTLLIEKEGKLISFPMAAQKIYQGALVVISAAGYASNAVVEAGSNFAGIAYEQKDNSAGAAGALSLRVETQGVWELPIAAATIADVGSIVYASANDIVTLTEGADKKPIVGKIVGIVSSTKVLVKLTSFVGTGA